MKRCFSKRVPMKKLISIALIVTITLTLAACVGEGEGNSDNPTLPESNTQSGEGGASNPTPANSVDTQGDKETPFIPWESFGGLPVMWGSGKAVLETSLSPRNLTHFNDWYPFSAEQIRKVNDELLYIIYKMECRSGLLCNMYLFFEKAHWMTNPDWEWVITGARWAAKTLTKDDFRGISVGSPVSNVVAIDPLLLEQLPAKREPYVHESWDPELEEYIETLIIPTFPLMYKTYHYTTDGIFCITFIRPDDDQEMDFNNATVYEIEFDASFEVESPWTDEIIRLEIDLADLPV